MNPIHPSHRQASEALEKWYCTGRSLTGGTGDPMEEVAQILADHFPEGTISESEVMPNAATQAGSSALPRGDRDSPQSKPTGMAFFDLEAAKLEITLLHQDQIARQQLDIVHKTREIFCLRAERDRLAHSFKCLPTQQSEAKEEKSLVDFYHEIFSDHGPQRWTWNSDEAHKRALEGVCVEAIRRAGIEVEKEAARITHLTSVLKQRDEEGSAWIAEAAREIASLIQVREVESTALGDLQKCQMENESLRAVANENAKLAEDRQTALAQKDARIEKLKDLVRHLRGMLIRHHEWHLAQGVQDETLNGLDMSAEYGESCMYADTEYALEQTKEIDAALGGGTK